MRRVFATVVIGHPEHVRTCPERMVQQTIRSYNAHLSRVEVVSYKDLADAAERALAFEEESKQAPPQPIEPEPNPDPWEAPADPSVSDPLGDEPPF